LFAPVYFIWLKPNLLAAPPAAVAFQDPGAARIVSTAKTEGRQNDLSPARHPRTTLLRSPRVSRMKVPMIHAPTRFEEDLLP